MAYKIDKKSSDFFEQYLNTPSPTGFEESGAKSLDRLFASVCGQNRDGLLRIGVRRDKSR